MASHLKKCFGIVYLISLLPVKTEHFINSEQSDEQKIVGTSFGDIAPPSAQTTALFHKLFQLKRNEHKDAVKRIVAIESNQKQHKLLELVISKIMEVLTQSRVKLEGSGYLPGSGFPQDETLQDSLSSMIENTAFMGDLVLYLPDETKLFLKNNEWSNIFKWSLSLCQESTFLDNITKKMLHLVAQELDLVEREASYFNPYAKVNKKADDSVLKPTEKKKTKKKILKGPSLSGNRFKNEL